MGDLTDMLDAINGRSISERAGGDNDVEDTRSIL